jgi:hypothetical protein
VVRLKNFDMSHDLGEIAFRGLDQGMIVVVHQAKGMNNHPISINGHPQIRKKFLPVTIAFKNILLFVPPSSDMIESAGELYS